MMNGQWWGIFESNYTPKRAPLFTPHTKPLQAKIPQYQDRSTPHGPSKGQKKRIFVNVPGVYDIVWVVWAVWGGVGSPCPPIIIIRGPHEKEAPAKLPDV